MTGSNIISHTDPLSLNLPEQSPASCGEVGDLSEEGSNVVGSEEDKHNRINRKDSPLMMTETHMDIDKRCSEASLKREEKTEEPAPTPPSSNRNLVCDPRTQSLSETDHHSKCDNNVGRRMSILWNKNNDNLCKDGKTGTRLKRKHVIFSVIEIRRYPMVLEENPACPCGPPLGLGWEYEVLPEMNIVDFESFRQRSRRLQCSHLVLSHLKRLEIIQRLGYKQEEIERVEKAMALIRRQRRMSLALSSCGWVEYTVQSLVRKVRHTFLGGGACGG